MHRFLPTPITNTHLAVAEHFRFIRAPPYNVFARTLYIMLINFTFLTDIAANIS